MARILLTHSPEELRTRFPDSARAALAALGEVRMNETGRILASNEVVALAQGCDVVLCDRLTPADAQVFASVPGVVALCRSAVDIRNIDVPAASRAGVLVTNASATFVDAVAELAFGLIIDLGRGITAAASAYHAGREPEAAMGRQLSGATLGVIGYGAIGRKVASLGLAFGMTVLACDPHMTDMQAGVARVALADLLAGADVVVCLAIANDQTDKLMDGQAFAAMQPTAIFVNLSRGSLVDDAALEEALKTGRIAGAAIDVGNEEGQMPSPALAALPNVIATPHIGGLTVQAAETQALETVGQVADVLQGVTPHHALNAEHATRFRDWAARAREGKAS